MAWLATLFSRDHLDLTHARLLFARGRHDDALELLAGIDLAESDALADEIRRDVATAHLGAALDACRAGQGHRMVRRLARARRYHTPALDPLFRRTERQIRAHQVRLTAAEHWLPLLEAADARQGHARYGLLARPRLIAQVAELWGEAVDADRIEAADRDRLVGARPLVAAGYPDDLADQVPALGDELVRAVLLVAVGRPDLAALPILELPASSALVCFERAQIAHLLDLPRLAASALQELATRLGGHRTIRRLNTGVFLAQIVAGLGDVPRALAVLDPLPVRFLGRRPVELYARLLVEAGRHDDARALLRDHLARHPDHAEAAAILADTTPDLPLRRVLAGSLALGDYLAAPPRARTARGAPDGDGL